MNLREHYYDIIKTQLVWILITDSLVRLFILLTITRIKICLLKINLETCHVKPKRVLALSLAFTMIQGQLLLNLGESQSFQRTWRLKLRQGQLWYRLIPINLIKGTGLRLKYFRPLTLKNLLILFLLQLKKLHLIIKTH